MSAKRSIGSRLGQFLGALVANVLGNLIAYGLLLVFAVVAAAVGLTPIRDALKAFLTLEIWVWVLLLAMLLESAAFLGASLWLVRRRPRPASVWVSEVHYGGVDWPVRPYANVAKYDVDPPICPADKTQLGLVVTEDVNDKPIPVGTLTFDFEKLERRMLKFRCLKCSKLYDLTGLGNDMGPLLAIVEQLALAEERRRRLAVSHR